MSEDMPEFPEIPEIPEDDPDFQRYMQILESADTAVTDEDGEVIARLDGNGLPIPVSELPDGASWWPVPEQDYFEELSAAAYEEEPDVNGVAARTPDDIIRDMWMNRRRH
jgi:hypothetical protein